MLEDIAPPNDAAKEELGEVAKRMSIKIGMEEKADQKIMIVGDWNTAAEKSDEVAAALIWKKHGGRVVTPEGITRWDSQHGSPIDWAVTNCNISREPEKVQDWLSDHVLTIYGIICEREMAKGVGKLKKPERYDKPAKINKKDWIMILEEKWNEITKNGMGRIQKQLRREMEKEGAQEICEEQWMWWCNTLQKMFESALKDVVEEDDETQETEKILHEGEVDKIKRMGNNKHKKRCDAGVGVCECE